MVLSWLGFVLICAVALNLVNGQHGNETSADRLELLFEKIAQLAEKVDKNAEEFNGKLSKLAEDVKRNHELIKDSTSELSNLISLCRMVNGALVCRTISAGDGWMVVQQRFDGTVNFNRNWQEYRDGFGVVGPKTEFWWGLERLHQLTKTGEYELLLEFKTDSGAYGYARYSDFVVEGESDKYRLAKLGGHSGSAGDINAFRGDKDNIPTGRFFSTHDSDNDIWRNNNCAVEFGGGWWYGWCGNGPNSHWDRTIKWLTWKNEALHYTRMLIRAKA